MLSVVLPLEFIYQGLKFHRNIKVNILLRNRTLGRRNDSIMMFLSLIMYLRKGHHLYLNILNIRNKKYYEKFFPLICIII